jgi:hypothetical protein
LARISISSEYLSLYFGQTSSLELNSSLKLSKSLKWKFAFGIREFFNLSLDDYLIDARGKILVLQESIDSGVLVLCV